MEFITVEQFKEQPKEIQEIFLDWWKCEPYDLYAFPWNRRTNKWCIGFCSNELQADSINKDKDVDNGIPVFTEGQLRRFIEDKTNGVIKNTQWHIEDNEISKRGYSIYLLKKNEYHVTRHYINLGEDLLESYWKVACMIAEESV